MVIRYVFICVMLNCIGLGATQGQNEDNIWLFGLSSMNAEVLGYQFGNTVIDFSEIEPIFYYDSLVTMDFAGTNSSICDAAGNLLLYTNGMQIYGSDHVPIEEGDTLAYSDLWEIWSVDDYYENGDDWLLGFPIVQGTLILPLNRSEGKYIVLYQILQIDEEESYVSSLNYSLISRIENSHYKVELKDEIIKKDNLNFGQIHTCRHANGRDWWLIQQNVEADSIFTYLISEQTIKQQSFFKKQAREEVSVTASQVAFSPNGELYAVANGQYLNEIGGEFGAVLRLFSFDRCYGNLQEIGTDTIENFGIRGAVAFSPSGQYMYTTSHEEMFQYDMYAEDWATTKKLIATYDGFIFKYTEESDGFRTRFGSMALAPDGRIYSVPGGSNRFLNVIEYPDEEGLESEVLQHKIMMPTENFSSIPNFPHYKMGPVEGSICDTLGLTNYLEAQFRFKEDSTNYLNIRFTDISYYEPDSWYWEFGDGTSYEGKSPYYHEYAEEGAYHVCLTVSRGSKTDTYCKTIFLGVTSNKEVFLNADQVNIYPNPVEEYLNVEIRDYIPSNLKAIVYNNLGKEILQYEMKSGLNQIEFEKYNSGLYHLLLVGSNGSKFATPFIKI